MLIAIYRVSAKYISGGNEVHCGFIFGTNMDSLSCVTLLYPVIIRKRRKKKRKKKKKKNFVYLRNSRTTVKTKKIQIDMKELKTPLWQKVNQLAI